VQNLLSSSLLSRNANIKIYRTIILLDFFYKCETLSLTLNEERRMRMFENTVLREYLDRKGSKWQVSGENYKKRS
jgi:hypothetical protein